MGSKAQGALEYLLLIGGAVLVVAIVIALITGAALVASTGAVCSSKTTYDACSDDGRCIAVQKDRTTEATGPDDFFVCLPSGIRGSLPAECDEDGDCKGAETCETCPWDCGSCQPKETYSSDHLKPLFLDLPTIDPAYEPSDPENRVLLYNRLTQAFDLYYTTYYSSNRNIATEEGSFYYFRQELQALLDMHRATHNDKYIKKARQLALKAIADASANQRTLWWGTKDRGTWPCFLAGVESTGGHGQLNDFQGAAGLMMVASALKQENMDGWQEISDFVESNIVEKWLYYDPDRTPAEFITPSSGSNIAMLSVLDRNRDKRLHFADICLALSELGYDTYPYGEWAQFIFDVYLTEKDEFCEAYPDPVYRDVVPNGWGIYHMEDDTLVWTQLGCSSVLDTSHANRTSWAICHTYGEGMLPADETLNNVIASFKDNIWRIDKLPSFYFNNYIDGKDDDIDGLGPGGIGNVWLGWHRLSAYDAELRDLFVSIAYDLTLGGDNVIGQNKGVTGAPLSLIAWASRLLAEDGQPRLFP